MCLWLLHVGGNGLGGFLRALLLDRPLEISLARIVEADYSDLGQQRNRSIPEFRNQEDLDTFIVKLENEMRVTAKHFEFEKAAKLRDRIKELRTKEFLFA